MYIDRNHLHVHQRQIVREMLSEQSSSFSQSQNDIDCVQKLQLKVILKES